MLEEDSRGTVGSLDKVVDYLKGALYHHLRGPDVSIKQNRLPVIILIFEPVHPPSGNDF